MFNKPFPPTRLAGVQVLIDPPWEEYARRAPHAADEETWTWQQVRAGAQGGERCA